MRRTLVDYQKQFGIKRIDFSKIQPTGIEEQYENEQLRCPYCKGVIYYDSEEIDTILHGTSWWCPNCEKNFYVTAEVTVNTTCTPMPDAVIDWRRHIENTYSHIDELERRGFDFPDYQHGFVEWEIYWEFAKPLFENERIEDDQMGKDRP